jgi:hypothetical protein
MQKTINPIYQHFVRRPTPLDMGLLGPLRDSSLGTGPMFSVRLKYFVTWLPSLK